MALTVGELVADRETDNTAARVVNLPPVAISEWQVRGRGTVASDNPEYPEDENVAIVVHESDLRGAYRNYTGGLAIPVKQLNRDSVPHYAFPRSRLRSIGSPEPREINTERIDPSPYHARNFAIEANRAFIAEIEERGHPHPYPVVRPRGDRWELLNGHRRLWACHVAGIERIPCHVAPLGKQEAAKAWAHRHLHGYTDREKAVALGRLRTAFGPGTETITENIPA